MTKSILGNPNNVTTVPINSKISYGTTIPIGNGGVGAVGSNGAYTISNTAGYNISPSVIVQNDPASLEVKGKIVHNGRDLEERLSTIEKVLQIPERDVKLEKKHPKLKKMYEDYIKALEKYRTWEAIKGDDNG